MKIVFLCGSLEPGRDGVGDYTRRLATYLTNQGHTVALVALHDRYVTTVINDAQIEEGIELLALRLPSNLKIAEKFNYAKKWIDQINPDWLSLQYVIYAFHNRGLPFSFHKRLKSLGKARKWHIMFHELWIGMATNDSYKQKLWGKLQKLLIKSLIKGLNPIVIHTQCDLYLEQLKREGYQIKKLPLFSNIDVYKGKFDNTQISKDFNLNSNSIKFVLFGGLHPEIKLFELICELKLVERSLGKSFEFLYIGRNGNELKNHLMILEKESVKYTVFGELDAKEISYLLSISSFGISTGSPQFLEKNGTVASMIAHKLPIICIGRDSNFKNIARIEMLKGIYFLQDVVQLLLKRPEVESSILISNIADKYISDLEFGE